jgi:hypothetical protein
MPQDETRPRRWYSCDPLKVAVTSALLGVAMACLATLVARDQIAKLPEPGEARLLADDEVYDPTVQPVPLIGPDVPMLGAAGQDRDHERDHEPMTPHTKTEAPRCEHEPATMTEGIKERSH